ncbi:MAG TPA: zinc/manganese transporter permease [Gammaproteobacteria bacterium]|nr:zinc/manganese transporter permease [Gammaproteobacteria bacterium]
MNSTELDILFPALLAGILVLSTHVPFGREVLARGIIFIDLAIAQIAGLGVIIAFSAGIHDGWQVQLAAACAALAGSVALYWAERIWADVQEAVIGATFVVASSAGLLLIANHPQGSEHLKEILVGQILWVDYAQLIPVAVLYSIVLILRRYFITSQSRLPFYLLFAVTITASVQLVGVYLVFASLILPALAVYRIRPPIQLPVAYLLGILAYVSGMIAASILDLPAGPMIILVLAGLSLVSLLAQRT